VQLGSNYFLACTLQVCRLGADYVAVCPPLLDVAHRRYPLPRNQANAQISLWTSLLLEQNFFSPFAPISAIPVLPNMASRTDARLMKSTKFPPEFGKKVDMQKVNLQVMKK
jgi:serine/arginine repetitive matrix protein 1